jgi:hypothetical protein
MLTLTEENVMLYEAEAYERDWDEALTMEIDRAWSEAIAENNWREREKNFDNDDWIIENSMPPDDNRPPFDVDAWRLRILALVERESDVKWEIGDCLVEGEQFYPAPPDGEFPGMGFYTEVAAITGLSMNTLRDLASTARRVSPSVRTDRLSWSHHRVLINALPDSDEDTVRKWLTRAADEQMTVAGLRKALKPPRPTHDKSFHVTVPLSVWEAIKDIADEAQRSVQAISAELLTEYATSEEGNIRRDFAKNRVAERRRKRRQEVGRLVARAYNPLRLEM